jgi:16S rRNA (cytosine967-C5)-methyltransferase
VSFKPGNRAPLRTSVAPQTRAAAHALAAAARAVCAVVVDGRSADQVLLAVEQHPERRAIRALTLGTLRWYLRYEPAVMPLMSRPAASTPPSLRALLVVAVHQLEQSRNPRESTVAAAVDAARLLDQPQAAGAVNAVLRRYLRERESIVPQLDRELAVRTAHPAWLVAALQSAWPQQVEQLLEANNQHPPMCLRVDESRSTRADYLALLAAAGIEAEPVSWLPGAITLQRPLPVSKLPGFAAGLVSVQDAGAQLAARLLAPRAGERILDACAAPGGKTGALLELAPDLKLTALDIDNERLQLVVDNLRRLGRSAQLVTADLAAATGWWDGTAYDAILLDAPCSATGVIRRHPDIKLLRRSTDIAALTERQLAILVTAFGLLRPGGRLLYVTCSVLPEENAQVIGKFLAAEPAAREATLQESMSGIPAERLAHGWQLLPGGTAGGDGFYYACLIRDP